MASPTCAAAPRRWLGGLMAGLVLLASAAVAGAETDKPQTGLSLVPADAAGFAALLRNREQVELFYKSNAYRTLRDLPAVKEAYKKAMDNLGEGKESGPLAMFRKWRQAKENKELLAVLTQAVSDEVFVYLGADWLDQIKVLNGMNSAGQTGMFQAMLSGENPNKGQARGMLRYLQENRSKLKIPALVFGFRLKGSEQAENQLKRLETLLEGLAENVEQAKGRFKRTKVGGTSYLTLDLDGSLIPWDDINFKDLEVKKEEYEELIAHAKKMTLTISLGVQGNYLLFGLTSSAKELAKLGSGKSLADRPELAPLAKFADQRLTGIGYTSAASLAAITTSRADLDGLAKLAKEALNKAEMIKEERRKAIAEDIDELFARARKELVPPGAQVSVSFLTNDGFEGYHYDYTPRKAVAGVNCKLHQHFGGDPIFAAAFACKPNGSGYREAVRVWKKIYGHLEAIGLDSADANMKEQYEKVTKAVFPVLRRFDEITSKTLLPSIKESGLGLVLDSKWTSKKWHQMAPELPKAMPAPELALLGGISDPKGFVKAMKEYRETLNELMDKVADVAPNGEMVRNFKLPPATEEAARGGTLYFWPVPEEVGLDKQVQPVLGVAKRVVVMALSKKHAERLMTPTPITLKTRPLARKEPLVAVCTVNWPALVDLVYPWAVTGVTISRKAGPDPEADAKGNAQFEAAMKQVAIVVDVLKAFKGGSMATYVEDGKLVTHSHMIFKDVSRGPASDQ